MPISLAESSERSAEVARVWRPRMAADERDVPCYDCASAYIYQFEPCGIESIRVGRWAWDDGDQVLPMCTEHNDARREKDAR